MSRRQWISGAWRRASRPFGTLAINTDGLAVVDSNDIERDMRRIVDDLTSYYLLGYYSSNKKLDGKIPRDQGPREAAGSRACVRAGVPRSISEKEMREGQQFTTAAQAAAPAGTLQVALASLAGIRPEISLRTDVSWVAAPTRRCHSGSEESGVGRERDRAASAGSPEWANGGEAQVLLTAADGVTLLEVTQPIQPASRTVSVQLPDVALAPGEFTLRLRLKPSGGGLPFKDTLRFSVPEEMSPIGRARIPRRGPDTGTLGRPHRRSAVPSYRSRAGGRARSGSAGPSRG